MNVANFKERSCERFRRYFDAYVDNELLVETNQDVLQHLTSCPDCKRILDSRARMKQIVRDAVTKDEAPLELMAALQKRFRTERRSFFGFNSANWVMAAAAVAVLVIGSFTALRWNRVAPLGGVDGGNVFQTVSARVGQILRVGLTDHVHCAILSGRWKRFMSFDDMKTGTGRQALGPEFIDLVPEVQSKLGPSFKIVQGHRCTANNRQYVHLILTGDNNTILSLVITEKQSESFTHEDAKAVIQASGIPIYQSREGIYEIAGFESAKYLAYVVSNLNHGANLDVASRMAPVVYEHLHRLEL